MTCGVETNVIEYIKNVIYAEAYAFQKSLGIKIVLLSRRPETEGN